MINLSNDDIKFLKDLQHELLTQDTVGQASPRFWVVLQEVKEYWVEDNTDGIFIYSSDDGDTVFEGDLSNIDEWFKERDDIKVLNKGFGYIEVEHENNEYYIFNDEDLKDFLDDYYEDNYNVGFYRLKDEIVPNTMFLTLRECKEHIKSNHYHYNNPRPYAMTAWRSPQVARLMSILESMKFEDYTDVKNQNK